MPLIDMHAEPISLQLCALHHVDTVAHVQTLGNAHALLNGREITVNKVRIFYLLVITVIILQHHFIFPTKLKLSVFHLVPMVELVFVLVIVCAHLTGEASTVMKVAINIKFLTGAMTF